MSKENLSWAEKGREAALWLSDTIMRNLASQDPVEQEIQEHPWHTEIPPSTEIPEEDLRF